jgi:F-type H+-transporting ATPase subunit gamma
MAKTRALVKRRQAVQNIRKITRTMELIATTRFKKAMDRASEAEAYTRKIAELAADLSASAGNLKHPLLETRETVKNSLLLVLTSNRGLCGGYNASILREAMARVRQVRQEGVTLHLELSGRRAILYFRHQRVAAEQAYTQFEDKPSFDEVEAIANRYLADYVAGRIDRVEVAYMKFFNAARQQPMVETLLPLSAVSPADPERRRQPAAPPGPPVEYE